MQQFYIFMISLGWLAMAHPFHISLTEINWNPKSEKLEISQKIFWDDLEIALNNFHKGTVDFLNPENPARLEKQVEAYLLTKNEIWISGKPIKLTLLGYEIDEDAAWFYMESEAVSRPSTLKVKNSALIEEFPDQKNVVQFFFENQSPTSIILGKGTDIGELSKD